MLGLLFLWMAHNVANLSLIPEVMAYPLSNTHKALLMALRVALPFGSVGAGYLGLIAIPLIYMGLVKLLARQATLTIGWRSALPAVVLATVSAVVAPATGMISVWTQPVSAQSDLLLEAAVGALLLTSILYALANLLTHFAALAYRRLTRESRPT